MNESWRDPGRAALITNTASGANRRSGAAAVNQRAAVAGLPNHALDRIEHLDDVLRRCALEDKRLLIVNAGDGTVCRLLDIVRAHDWFAEEPVIALLRGGTTNMIHRDVGWPGRPEAALGNLLTALGDGHCGECERHVLRIHRAGSDIIRHGFFFATHAVVRAILRVRGRLHSRASTGTVSEILSTGAMIWRLLRGRIEHDPVLRPVPLEVSRDQGEWRRVSHILLMAMTLRKMILGVRPLARDQGAGVAALNAPHYRILPWLWRLARGRSDPLQSLSLRGEFSWILDGEVYDHHAADGVLSVDVGEPVRFLVPAGRS
ncbi:MAG: diacylglycerol kinase family protein [Gammaproteobacteria bacterium]|nr:diacylglycerol kinase family protein [Gammaproteobacteria bacterium]